MFPREDKGIYIDIGSNLSKDLKSTPAYDQTIQRIPTPDRNGSRCARKTMFSIGDRNICLVTSFELQEKSFAIMSSLLIFFPAGIIFFRKI